MIEQTYERLIAGEISYFFVCNGVVAEPTNYSWLHIFPGSFNPLHQGHRAIYKIIEAEYCVDDAWACFEVSVRRRGKEPLPLSDLLDRFTQFDPDTMVCITNADYFVKKAGALAEFEMRTFHIGFDTARRLLTDDEVSGVQGIAATFVVYDRNGEGFANLPKIPYNMSEGPLIDLPISSTQLREAKRLAEPGDVGVIVSRFQVADLEPGHVELISRVTRKHPFTIVALSSSPAKLTKSDPLSYEIRADMIREKFPDVIVVEMSEYESNEKWSEALDRMAESYANEKNIVLYGAKDTFTDHYCGINETEILEPQPGLRGVTRHDSGPVDRVNSRDFRAGVLYAIQTRYAAALATTDIIVLAVVSDADGNAELWVLLGRKPSEVKFRIFGGFVDPTDPSVKAGAIRECFEESNLVISDLVYLGDSKVPDWRYQGADQIFTSVYATVWDGLQVPMAGDDICEIMWCKVEPEIYNVISLVHYGLMDILFKALDQPPQRLLERATALSMVGKELPIRLAETVLP